MEQSQSKTFMLPGSGYGYTGAKIDPLQSPEYTLFTDVYDKSSSVRPFQDLLNNCIQEVIKALRYSPAEATLMYRHCHFSTQFEEIHGFIPLAEVNPDFYAGKLVAGGQTALYPSAKLVIDATVDYSKQMAAKLRFTNGIIILVTDGQHYLEPDSFGIKMDDVKKSLAQAVACESLESLMTILVGVNPDPDIRKALEDFKVFCDFTQFIPIEEANAESIAKLVNFISRSVVSQSQYRGSGGPSKSLTF